MLLVNFSFPFYAPKSVEEEFASSSSLYFSWKVEGASGGPLIQSAGVCMAQVGKQAPKTIGRRGGTL